MAATPRNERAAASATGEMLALPPAQGRVGKTQWQVAWEQFRRHRIARAGLVVLAIFYVTAVFADFLAPYPERFIDPTHTFAPPSRIHLVDGDGRLRGPYVHPVRRELDLETFETIWAEDTSRVVPISFFTAGQPYRFLGVIPMNLRLFGVGGTTRVYLWGADRFGQDIFSKIWYGARVSLAVGLIVAAVSVGLGLLLGGIAGYFGGLYDVVIMRLVEVLDAIPTLFLLLTLSTLFRPLNLPPSQLFFVIVGVLAFVSWGGLARAIRGQVLTLKTEEFAQAALALGGSDSRVIVRHLLPQTATWVIVSLSFTIPGAIGLESALSFLGVGIQPPATSWGLQLAQGTGEAFNAVDRLWLLIPGVFIFLAIMCWNLVGDGLRDALDPRQRR